MYLVATLSLLLLTIIRGGRVTWKKFILILTVLALICLNIGSLGSTGPWDKEYSLLGYQVVLYSGSEFIFPNHFLISTILFVSF